MSRKVARCDSNQVAVNHLLNLYYKYGPQQKKTILKAIDSLCIYPLPIQTEEEAQTLKGVGTFLAKEILKSFQQNSQSNKQTKEKSKEQAKEQTNKQTKESNPPPIYKPEFGGGSWAIMIALKILDGQGTKKEILECLEMNSIKVTIHSSCSLLLSLIIDN